MAIKQDKLYQAQKVKEAFNELFDQGNWWHYTGEKVKVLRDAFARYHGAKYGVSVSNGSVGLDVALRALDLPEGAEIILPAYDFFSLPKSVINAGAKPVFVDVNAQNFTIDAQLVASAVTSKTAAIVAVHINGSVPELDKLRGIADKQNLLLIEDCAQAHGGIYDGRKVGSWGDIGLFSFGGIKLMTSGQGGMIITSDESIYNKTHAMVNRGYFPDGELNDVDIIGENFQLSEMQAAILLPQLEALTGHSEAREKAARYLNENLSELPNCKPLTQFQKTEISAHMSYTFEYMGDQPALKTAIANAGFPIMGGYSAVNDDARLFNHFGQAMDFPNAKRGQQNLVSVHHALLLDPTERLDEFVEVIRSV